MFCVRLYTQTCFKFFYQKITSTRIQSISSASNPQRYSGSEQYWRDRDGLQKNWELIYKAPADTTIAALSTFATVSPVVLVGAGIYYYVYNFQDPNAPVYLSDSDVIIADNMTEFTIYIAAYVLVHIVLKIFISRYVIRLYKNGENYKAIFRGSFYNQVKQHNFHIKDFKRLKMPMIVSWGDARYSLGSKKGILITEYFKTPRHLMSMLQTED